ncbi:MAG: hypothetical protein ACK4I8_09855 [Armatimonadota bacterium]
MRRVVSERFPFAEVEWEVREQRSIALAFIDTGFDGFLMLPTNWMRQLGTPDRIDWWQLADGSFVAAPTYFGTTRFVGTEEFLPCDIIVMGNEVIVGLDLVRHYLVTLERGQRVIIEP